MAEEIYLAQPKKESLGKFFPELARLYDSSPYVFENIPPQQLFAPDRFIFGHFVKMGRDSLFLSGSLYFTSSVGNLFKYQSGIEKNRLDIIRRISISQSDVEDIKRKSERYINFRENSTCGGEAFSMRGLRNYQNNFVQSLLNVLNEAEVR